MTDARLEVERAEDAGSPVIIRIKGEIDLSNSDELEASVRREGAGVDVALDLSEVAFMDSSAVAMIVQVRSDALAHGHTLVVRNPSERARRLLELVALDFLIEDGA